MKYPNMHFRSSPMLLFLFSLALFLGVFFWSALPRLWGGTYRVTFEQEQGSESKIFRLSGDGPATLHLQKLQSFTIENALPNKVVARFVLMENGRVSEQVLWEAATSSTLSLQLATSGAWKCESDIIRMCGTVYVEE